MPSMDGFELKEKIQQNDILRKKVIPFIYLSTEGRQSSVEKAYDLMAQGYFQKDHVYEDLV